MACKLGVMAQNMMGSGRKVKPMDRDKSFIQMAIDMKENGLITGTITRESIHTRTARFMRANGKTIKNTVLASKSSPERPASKENLSMARNKEKAHFNGPMAPVT